MVVGVVAVQLVEHLSDSSVQSGSQKLDILLHAQVQNAVDALSQMEFDIWSQSNLQRQIRCIMEKREDEVQRGFCFTNQTFASLYEVKL